MKQLQEFVLCKLLLLGSEGKATFNSNTTGKSFWINFSHNKNIVQI